MIRPIALALLSLSASAPLLAQDLDFQIAPTSSSADVATDASVALPGSVVGDYDATNNPGGTRTVPGLFGGSGNNAIPMDLGLGMSTSFLGAPTGSFGLDLDTNALTVIVHDLDIDLLGEGNAATAVTLSMLYQTFRTFAPDSLYLGGVPFDVPIAGQTISDMQLVQTDGGALGTLIAGFAEGDYLLQATVGVELSFVIESQGQLTPVGPVQTVLPLAGIVSITDSGATTQLDFMQSFQQLIPDPLPGFAIDDQALPLPTILPAGSTANLLLDAVIASIDVSFSTTVALTADGTPSCGFSTYCNANTNSTGVAGVLVASGSADVADQSLTLSASQLPANVNGLFFMSQSRNEVPIFRSQGILCLGSPQIRFAGQVQNSGAAGTMVLSPDFTQLPQGVVFQPGSTWNFQVWFRDANPLNTSNTTSAAEVRFCP